MARRRRVTLLTILILSASPAVFSRAAEPPALRVATSNTVLADLAANVGGEQVSVQALVPRGADPHTFQPTPASMRLLSEARVIFFNGGGLEEWWTKTLQSVRPAAPVIELSKGLTALALPEPGRERQGLPDPHVWLDPMLTKTYVDRLREALSRADPGHAGAYAERAKTYQGELDVLDAWIRGETAKVPPARRKLVTFHDAFGYFAKRYGYAVKGYIVASPGKEPSAKALAELTRRITQEGVPAIFAEADHNPKLLEALGRDAGVKVVTDLYDDSLSDGPPADSYLHLMRHDVTQITNALK